MAQFIRKRISTPFLLILFAAVLSATCTGQTTTTGSGLTCPSSGQGPFNWQVDQAAITTTFSSETGFCTGIGFFQIPVTIPAPTTIHEIHGNYAFAVWNGGTCNNGSIIASILDQNANKIAEVKLEQFGPATIDLPISGTFPAGLSITGLTMQFYADQCPALTFSWSLVMS